MRVEPLRPEGDPERIGQYRLTGRLGEGGQGVVYRGEDDAGRQVAVKVFHRRVVSSADVEVYRKLQREVDVMSRVSDFYAAKIRDFGADDKGVYLVTEYVDGPSLQDFVDENGPLQDGELARVMHYTILALVAMHQAKVLHRDFTPRNVLMGPDGPRVIDFGIARVLDTKVTVTRRVVGTPAYIAPEVLRAEHTGPRADVFSWAATMVFAATGQDAFHAPSLHAVTTRVLTGEPDLRGVPLTYRELIERCLVKDPKLRPDARDVLNTLLGFDDVQAASPELTRPDQTPVSPPPEKPSIEPPKRSSPRTVRRRWRAVAAYWGDLTPRQRLLAGATTLVLLLTGGTVVASLYHHHHCGTFENDLINVGRECVGVADGNDHEVFGDGDGERLRNVMKLIDDENATATKVGPGHYATIAFMGPLTSRDQRIAFELEGAYTAQHQANMSNDLKIKLVLANQGSDETHWKYAVTPLEKMMTGPDHLLAVTGLGLSQDESVAAARTLANAKPFPIPMVGDTISADGFDATGTIDDKGPIPGLVQIAPNNTSQLNAISTWPALQPTLNKTKKAALVEFKNTSAGSFDLYNTSLYNSFRDNHTLGKFIDHDLNFTFGPPGKDSTLEGISDKLCPTKPNLLYYAGRTNPSLPTFLKLLHGRRCNNTPITVITGSDAADLHQHSELFDPKAPILNDPRAPITVVYTPLADPKQLDNTLYRAFEAAFTQNFPNHAADLNTGWAINAGDAVFTAVAAIRNAATNQFPSTSEVSNQLKFFTIDNVVRGASGNFNIDPKTGDRIYPSRSLHPVQLGSQLQ